MLAIAVFTSTLSMRVLATKPNLALALCSPVASGPISIACTMTAITEYQTTML